jgi:hypothetical protein
MLTPAQAEERLRKIAIPASFPQVRRQPRLQPPSGSYPISGSGWKIPYVPTMRSAPQDRAPSARLPPIGLFSTGSGAVSVHQTLLALATIGGQSPQCMSPEASAANYPGKRIAHIPTMGGADPNHTVMKRSWCTIHILQRQRSRTTCGWLLGHTAMRAEKMAAVVPKDGLLNALMSGLSVPVSAEVVQVLTIVVVKVRNDLADEWRRNLICQRASPGADFREAGRGMAEKPRIGKRVSLGAYC